VSAPVTWDEVAGDPNDLWFEADSVLERVERNGDLHAGALTEEGRLPG
jgi:DNA primase